LLPGLDENAITDLAYLVFAANCRDERGRSMMRIVSGQLSVSDVRAEEVERLMSLVLNTFARMKEATGDSTGKGGFSLGF
jgi:hypothetical protein